MEDVKTNRRGAIDYLMECISTLCDSYKNHEQDIDGAELGDIASMIETIYNLPDDAKITIFENPMSASGLSVKEVKE